MLIPCNTRRELLTDGVLHGRRGTRFLRVIHGFKALFRLSLRCNTRVTDVQTEPIVMIIVSSSGLISSSISAKV